jgi:prepilin-type N-terminal cleavage/methylation domain-containing protein
MMSIRTYEQGNIRGFTLIEVLVSIMILSVGSLALGTLLIRGARTATAASAVSYQTAALSGEVGRLGAMPFSQLAAGNTCVDVTTGPFLHTRCALIVDVSAKVKRVTVTVTPTAPTSLQPLSSSFERTISGEAVNPLFGL